jgi:hypothetical protein
VVLLSVFEDFLGAFAALLFLLFAGFAEVVALLPDCELDPPACAMPKPAQSTTMHTSAATFFTDFSFALMFRPFDPVKTLLRLNMVIGGLSIMVSGRGI